jgi:hypothetical protein
MFVVYVLVYFYLERLKTGLGRCLSVDIYRAGVLHIHIIE